MCCFNDPRKLKSILAKLGPDDLLKGWKIYRKVRGWGYESALMHMRVRVNKDNSIHSDTRKKIPYFTQYDVEKGLHVFTSRGKAEDVIQHHSGECVIFPVYGYVRDLLAVDNNQTAVFTKVYVTDVTKRKLQKAK